MRVSIVGAGPSGNYAAYLLAKQGHKVTVVEEHDIIGKPVQCTGLLTSSIDKILDLPKEVILNKISKARIFAPDGSFVNINFKSPEFVVDRTKFDQYLADLAVSQGVDYSLRTKFVGLDNNKLKLSKKGKFSYSNFDLLIGADGPYSAVGKAAGLLKNRKHWVGIQARVKTSQPNIIQFFPYIGVYAWVVPESKDVVRVGVALKQNQKFDFKNFVNQKLGDAKILSYISGIIPVYNPSFRTQKDNVFLLGDAAAQVKATTGGGIIRGLQSAKSLADSLENDMSYHKTWKRRIGFKLWVDLMIRRSLDKMSDKDYNLLIKLCNGKRVKNVLETVPRENAFKIVLLILFYEPRFLYFIKLLLKKSK